MPEKEPLPADELFPIQQGEGFFILNEGKFNAGNASVDYFRYSDNKVFYDLYGTQNEAVLGDVLQSMTLANGQLFLVVNNSQKIEVVEPDSFLRKASIGPFPSPRNLLVINPQKAYLTDLFANHIYVVDPVNMQKLDSIPAGGWTEELVQAGGEVFVANRFTRNIYVVNTISDNLTDTIEVGFDPASMAVDKNGKIWAICSGDAAAPDPGGLWRIDPVSRQVEAHFEFSDFNTGIAPKIRFNGAGDTFHYLKNDIFKMSVDDTELPPYPVISATGRTLYSLEVHPLSGEVFTSDAVDFAQRGTVYRYSPNGNEIMFFKAGVNPNGFVFY